MEKILTKSSFQNYEIINNLIEEKQILINEFITEIQLNLLFTSQKFINTIKNFYNLFNSKLADHLISEKILEKEKISNFMNLFEHIDGLGDSNIEDSKNGMEFKKFNNIKVNTLKFEIKGKIIHIENYFLYNDKFDIKKLQEKILMRTIILIKYNYDNKRLINISKIIDKEPIRIFYLLYNLNREVKNKNFVDQTELETELNLLKYKGKYNCSSGYTYFFVHQDTAELILVISRIPEVLGLSSHELGHLLGWDYSIIYKTDNNYTFYLTDLDNSQKIKLKNNLPIKSDIFNFWETYVNTITTLIYSIFNSFELDVKVKNFEEYYITFQKVFLFEILYSILHSAKILNFLGYKNFDEFFENKNKNISFYQHARLFEYSIARSFLFLDFYDFFQNDLENDKYNKCTFNYKYQNKIYTNLEDREYLLLKENINKRNEKIIDLIIGNISDKKENKKRQLYCNIYNYFTLIIKNQMIINMEYFCIDINQLPTNYTGKNFKEKYLKYKNMYLKKKKLFN